MVIFPWGVWWPNSEKKNKSWIFPNQREESWEWRLDEDEEDEEDEEEEGGEEEEEDEEEEDEEEWRTSRSRI